MTDAEWSRAICKIDGNAYRKWLEEHSKATPEEIKRVVGETGPALKNIATGKF